MDLGFEHQTLRIYQQMALSALDLLATIVSPLSSHASSLHRLAIHYAGARLRFALHADPQTFSQGGVHPLPGAVDAPSSEVMVDGLPRRKVMGK
jgi:hypothetical protein